MVFSPTTMTVDRETLQATASAFVSAYNTWDLENILSDSWRSPSCVLQVLPLSLGRPALDNVQYREYFGGFLKAFRNFHVTVKDTIIDEKEMKVSIWASSTADTDIGPYKNEYVLILKCGEDGKVKWIGEFVDSNVGVTFFPKLRKFLEEQEKST
jgi:hypothetical protein